MRVIVAIIMATALLGACKKEEKQAVAPVDQELIDRGEVAFVRRCSTCHDTMGDSKRVGPSLGGLVGRKSGTSAGFPYSPAMVNAGVIWDAETIDKYLADPQGMIPGTVMQIDPVTDPEEREAIIAYLLQQN